jgi:hypothetical protein
MMKQDRILWFVVAVLLISVVVLLSYIQFFKQSQEMVERVDLNPACQPSQLPCETKLHNGGDVQFDISPQPVEVMKPLDVRVELKHIKPQRVVAQFNGVGMNMGMNRYIFKKSKEGSYHATVTLPVCVRDRMDWEAEIFLETERGTIIVPFKFEAIKQ